MSEADILFLGNTLLNFCVFKERYSYQMPLRGRLFTTTFVLSIFCYNIEFKNNVLLHQFNVWLKRFWASYDYWHQQILGIQRYCIKWA